MNQDIYSHERYVFFLAHPGDELYIAILLRNCVLRKKNIRLIYATSSDSAGTARVRERETVQAVSFLGIPEKSITFLRHKESEIISGLAQLLQKTNQALGGESVDIVVSPDFAGGHEAHDVVCFCSATVANERGVRSHYVYPLYYGPPSKRLVGRFLQTYGSVTEALLGESDKTLKERMIRRYESLRGYFNALWLSNVDNHTRFFARELYMVCEEPINFRLRPTIEIGYEFHSNGFRFSDFAEAVEDYYQQYEKLLSPTDFFQRPLIRETG